MWRGKRSLHHRISGEVCSHSLDDLKCLLLSLKEHNLLGLHQSFKCHEKAHHNITHTKIVFFCIFVAALFWPWSYYKTPVAGDRICWQDQYEEAPSHRHRSSISRRSCLGRSIIHGNSHGGYSTCSRCACLPACLSTCFVYLFIDLQKTCWDDFMSCRPMVSEP